MQLAAVSLGTVVNDKGDILLNVGEAGTAVLIGLVVVFSVLVALTCIIWLFGKVMDGLSGKGKKSKAVPEKTEKPVSSQDGPIVEEGVSPSVVAVIAAAVAAMMGKGKFTLRKISRASGRKAWGSAGAAENVRPF